MNRIKTLLILCLIITTTAVSCNYIKDSKNSKEDVVAFKKEANYLSELAKENLNIIEICESFDTLKLNKNLEKAIQVIKVEQKEIHQNIKNLADNNIVLISDLPQENYKISKIKTENSFEVKKAITFIQQKRQNQLNILENLEDVNTNGNTKIVAKTLKKTIKKNINTTKNTLKTLK